MKFPVPTSDLFDKLCCRVAIREAQKPQYGCVSFGVQSSVRWRGEGVGLQEGSGMGFKESQRKPVRRVINLLELAGGTGCLPVMVPDYAGVVNSEVYQ